MLRFILSNILLYILLEYLYFSNLIVVDLAGMQRLMDILISASSGIFAVVGIWFAVIYPEYIGLLRESVDFSQDSYGGSLRERISDSLDSSSTSLSYLIRSLLYSLMVILLVLFSDFLLIILKANQAEAWLLSFISILVVWVANSYFLAVRCIFTFVLSADEKNDSKVTRDDV